MVNSVPVEHPNRFKTEPSYEDDFDADRVGVDLLHQQLYVLGRDIVSRHGNLLIEFGCRKTPTPIPHIPSTYAKPWNSRSRIAFRGFGVFVGDDSVGGIFVHRYTFEPRWMPSSRFEPIPWLPKDVPRTRRSRTRSEREAARRLMGSMIDWFIAYETWIVARLGFRFRVGQLVHFPSKDEQSIHYDMGAAWRAIAQAYQRS